MKEISEADSRISGQTPGDDIFYDLAATPSDRHAVDLVMEKYPVKITPFLKKIIKWSPAIKKQYLPSPDELLTIGSPTPFEEGKDASATYGLERLYRDRVLITPSFDCPAYCRFCYKKSRVMRNKPEMTYAEIDRAVSEIEKMESVRGVLITGGEPFLNIKKLFYVLDRLKRLKNIFEIRIGTRTLLTVPQLFTNDLCDRLASVMTPNHKDPLNSKYLALNVHFNHPDELLPEVIKHCGKLTSRGIILRNQTVLLKGINDRIPVIKKLFALLIRNRMIPYYFNHCFPVEGSDHLRTTVQKGLDIYRYLCTESSTIIPHYVYAPFGGKVHVGPDTELKYLHQNGNTYIKTKMLYKASEFRQITRRNLPPFHIETDDGFIEALYLDGNTDEAVGPADRT